MTWLVTVIEAALLRVWTCSHTAQMLTQVYNSCWLQVSFIEFRSWELAYELASVLVCWYTRWLWSGLTSRYRNGLMCRIMGRTRIWLRSCLPDWHWSGSRLRHSRTKPTVVSVWWGAARARFTAVEAICNGIEISRIIVAYIKRCRGRWDSPWVQVVTSRCGAALHPIKSTIIQIMTGQLHSPSISICHRPRTRAGAFSRNLFASLVTRLPRKSLHPDYSRRRERVGESQRR